MDKTAIERAIEKAGGQTALAKLVGRSQGAVSQWVRERKVPAEMAVKIERATGVPRYELRPDLFDAPPKQARAA